MGDKSAIEWTEATWNPLAGCTRASAGCDVCYAARLAATKLKHTEAYRDLATITPSGRAAFNGTIRLLPERLDQPLRWRRPRRIFVNSMSDLFHEGVPDEYIDRVFAVMALAPRHTFQVLTKRPKRMRDYLLADRRDQMNAHAGTLMHWEAMPEASWPLPNVWPGVSTEDQATADERIPLLLETPAAVRWISAEPLLGPLDLGWSLFEDRIDGGDGRQTALDWVVVGGESGPGARPMNPAWAESLRDQCVAAGVPFLFKQWGGRTSKAGGRHLDGRTWDQYPGGA